jgi:transcriptional regulator with XRE-family HTH domain
VARIDVRNVRNLGDYIREQRSTAQISLRQLAKTAGVSNPYLSQIERGLRKPSAEILQQIAKALRISAEALYVQAGILDERYGDSDVPTAVLGDPGITERQKQVLLEIYDSFRKENEERDDAVAADTPADPAAASVDDVAVPAGAEPTAEADRKVAAPGKATKSSKPKPARTASGASGPSKPTA